MYNGPPDKGGVIQRAGCLRLKGRRFTDHYKCLAFDISYIMSAHLNLILSICIILSIRNVHILKGIKVTCTKVVSGWLGWVKVPRPGIWIVNMHCKTLPK